MDDIGKRIKDSQAQEAQGMADLGGVRHGGSGAAWSRKADGRRNSSWVLPDHLLVEFKRTDKKSYSIKSSELEKLFNEAVGEGRVPLLGIGLNNREYILMERDDYAELLDLLTRLLEAVDGRPEVEERREVSGRGPRDVLPHQASGLRPRGAR